MNKTKIEWCDYTVNPVKGYCPVGCSYCYARRMYNRFHWDKTIKFDYTVLLRAASQLSRIEPSRIFVGSTIELFGEWVEINWIEKILRLAKIFSQHTFIFLTKKPENLAKWNPWPKNTWIGATATDNAMYEFSMDELSKVEATTKFISFEPLLEPISWRISDIQYSLNWAIIGAETGVGAKPPKQEWVQNIIDASDKAGIPIFLKDNLHWPEKRQEFPITR